MFENVANVTVSEVIAALKNQSNSIQNILQMIRHPSFPLNKVDELLSLLDANIKDVNPKLVSAGLEAIMDKANNFRIPMQLQVNHLEFLDNLIIYLPGILVSRLSLPALDLYLDKLHNIIHAGDNPDDITKGIIFSDMSRLRALCTRVFSLKHRLTSHDVDNVYFLLFCAPAPVCSTIRSNDIVNKKDLLLPIGENFWTASCAFNTLDKTAQTVIQKGKMKGLVERGAGCARELSHKFLSVVNLTNTWSEINRIEPVLGCMAPVDIRTVFNDISCDNAEEALLSSKFTSPLALRVISQRCILPAIHPSNVTCTELGTYGQYLTSFPESFVRRIPQATICHEDCQSLIFGNFGYQNIPQGIKNYMMKRCRPTGPIDTATLGRLRGMIVKLPMESVDSLSAADIATVLNDVKQTLKADTKKDPRRRAVIRKMARKLTEAGSIVDIIDNKDFMKQLSLKDLRNVQDVSQLYNSSAVLDLPDSQNKFFMKKVLQTTPIENMTATSVREIKSLVKGLLSSQIARFNPAQRMDIAVELCAQSNWPVKSVKAINRRLIVADLKRRMDTDPMSIFSPFDVGVLGCECLLHFKPTELAAMSTDACQATCKAIGSCSNFQCLNNHHRQGVLASCMTCMNLTSTLTVENFADLGSNLMQELSGDHIATMIPDNLMTDALMYFQGGCLSVPVREALKTKIISGIGTPASFDRTTYESLLELIMIFTDAERDAADMTIINELTGDIIKALNPEDDNSMKLKECCKLWLSDSDKEIIKTRTRALYSTLMKAKRFVMSSVRRRRRRRRRRRKRSTVTWTCSEIQSVGAAFTDASLSELNSIDDSEFTTCISHLGSLSGWSAEQTTILYNRTAQLQGSTCEMSETEIVDMGSIVLGMSVSDIGCLNFTTDDLILALGNPSTWSAEQLTELASTFNTKKDVVISDLTASDLTNMRHILCGYPATDLNNITAEALHGCGSQLGSLSADLCSIEHIQALANKALDTAAYGPIHNWDASILSEIGIITAGLSGENLASLSTSAIEGLSSSAIPHIPTSALAAMSPDQFTALSAPQAVTITATQKNGLSADQLSAVESALYGDDVPETTSPPPTDSGNQDAVEIINVVLSISMGLLCLCLFLPTY